MGKQQVPLYFQLEVCRQQQEIRISAKEWVNFRGIFSGL